MLPKFLLWSPQVSGYLLFPPSGFCPKPADTDIHDSKAPVQPFSKAKEELMEIVDFLKAPERFVKARKGDRLKR